jgi:RNA polymerase-binding transcription factor DksA
MTFDYQAHRRQESERRRQDPAYRAQQREWNKAWRAANPPDESRKAKRAAQEQARRDNPAFEQRIRARIDVRNALRRGDLTRGPCEVCGEKAEAHHDDYSQPLVVRWLCRQHHAEHHAKAEGA